MPLCSKTWEYAFESEAMTFRVLAGTCVFYRHNGKIEPVPSRSVDPMPVFLEVPIRITVTIPRLPCVSQDLCPQMHPNGTS